MVSYTWPDSIEGFPTFTWEATVPAGGHIELFVVDFDGGQEWSSARDAKGIYLSPESLRKLWEQGSISDVGKLKFKVDVVEGKNRSKSEGITVDVPANLLEKLKPKNAPEAPLEAPTGLKITFPKEIYGHLEFHWNAINVPKGGKITLKTWQFRFERWRDYENIPINTTDFRLPVTLVDNFVEYMFSEERGEIKFMVSVEDGKGDIKESSLYTTKIGDKLLQNLKKREMEGDSWTILKYMHDQNPDWFESYKEKEKTFKTRPGEFLYLQEAIQKVLKELDGENSVLFDSMMGTANYGHSIEVKDGKLVGIETIARNISVGSAAKDLLRIDALDLEEPLDLARFPQLQKVKTAEGWTQVGAKRSELIYVGGEIINIWKSMEKAVQDEDTGQLNVLLGIDTSRRLEAKFMPRPWQFGGKSTILEYAAQKGKEEVVKYLLDNYGSNFILPLQVLKDAHAQVADLPGLLAPKRARIRKMLEKEIENQQPSNVKQKEDLPPIKHYGI